MTGPLFALVFNAFVALLFATTFLLMSRLDTVLAASRWFALSYAVGALTPLSELMVSLARPTAFWVMSSYVSFAGAFAITHFALHRYFGQPVSWRVPAALIAGAIGTRLAIWGGQRDSLAYELAYQAPFAILTGLCALAVLRLSSRGPIDRVLAGAFALTSLHFLIKPFLAEAFGSGATATAYAQSLYAMFSQAGTGILLIATGLVLTMVLLRDSSSLGRRAAETDPLSELLNRRGFDGHARAVLASTRRTSAVLMIDIDRFKEINDTFGHAAGDQVIVLIAGASRDALPGATIGRIGGEEFVAILPGADAHEGLAKAEAIRAAVKAIATATLPAEYRISVSVGVAVHEPGDNLDDSMARADEALYQAKRSGRDRVWFAGSGAISAMGHPDRTTSRPPGLSSKS
ncbi:MAG: GGDEF domain-containing protein [Phreatobacter sp.]|uniref:GGDEF domain-containing protein n=1 Tax=Phreatobacter sp. TaxID=1966341 RepID=UPI001A5464CD|nr:GGDEF domain-containing protein [Phreatobacter sp.]MBL8570299.1 GGDEF domain-containing protein [Phreatobacter sp.]